LKPEKFLKEEPTNETVKPEPQREAKNIMETGKDYVSVDRADFELFRRAYNRAN
jgi:hypothetical protein